MMAACIETNYFLVVLRSVLLKKSMCLWLSGWPFPLKIAEF